jgi:hypothetical protein|tara:strand:- start:2669 stop:2935 length:267 start_codon:yes stop_codon:yes gene_type:complete
MPKTDEDKVREQLNQGIWDQSSDELRKMKMDRYARGESDGSDLPDSIRRQTRGGSLFGKAITVAFLFGVAYLLYRFGGALSAFVRSLF